MKKWLSLFLVFAMCMSFVPANVFAEETYEEPGTVTEEVIPEPESNEQPAEEETTPEETVTEVPESSNAAEETAEENEENTDSEESPAEEGASSDNVASEDSAADKETEEPEEPVGAGQTEELKPAAAVALQSEMAPQDESAVEGSCGENTAWSIADGVLTISGVGSVSSCNDAVWSTASEVVVEEGITSISLYGPFGTRDSLKITFKGDAPSMGENLFSGIASVTAYYPAGNTTWTETAKRNYGADLITWVVNGIAITQDLEASKEVKAGGTAELHIEAEGEEVAYQWQYKLSGGTTWINCQDVGCNTDTFSFTANNVHNNRTYRCVVTDKYGNQKESTECLLTVGKNLIITQDLEANKEVKAGGTAELHIEAEGEEVAYQWQYKLSGGTTWINCQDVGCNTDTFSFTANNVHNNRTYRCVVTDKNGVTLESNSLLLTVKHPLTITTQPESLILPSGTNSVTFTVTASGDGLTYQWQQAMYDSEGQIGGYTDLPGGSQGQAIGISGTTTDTLSLTMAGAFNGWTFRCVITDAYGDTAATDNVKLDLYPEAELGASVAGQAEDTYLFIAPADGTYAVVYLKEVAFACLDVTDTEGNPLDSNSMELSSGDKILINVTSDVTFAVIDKVLQTGVNNGCYCSAEYTFTAEQAGDCEFIVTNGTGVSGLAVSTSDGNTTTGTDRVSLKLSRGETCTVRAYGSVGGSYTMTVYLTPEYQLGEYELPLLK